MLKSTTVPMTSALTIVNSYATYSDYEFGEFSDQACEALLSAFASCPTYLAKSKGSMCTYLRVYLFLTGERVTKRTLTSMSMLPVALGFVGALNSTKFLNICVDGRKRYTSAFVLAITKLNSHMSSLNGLGRGRCVTDRESQLAAAFDARKFSEDRRWLLRGWWTRNKNGLRCHLPLYPIYVRLGREFTERFYEACAAYFRGRLNAHFVAVRSLIDFIAKREDVTEANLLDRAFVSKFWRDFMVHYAQVSYRDGKGMRASTIISGWNNQFIPLVRDSLVPAGLFADPIGGYPNPRGKSQSTFLGNVVVEDGIQVKTKLLTHVPLHLDDAQALQTLLVDVRQDFELIRCWAEAEVMETNARIARRLALHAQGTSRVIQAVGTNSGGHKFISSQDNPNSLANAAATLNKYGFVPRGVEGMDVRLLFPPPLDETARELGLPVTGSIVPYLAILVAEHPAITVSYLENFRLYSPNGTLVGLVKTDSKFYLVGDKPRRGADDAEQQILLSDRARAAVEGLVNLTRPVRDYMREQGDDDWRYFLLSCGKGFGRPYRIRKLSPQTSFKERICSIATGLQRHCRIPWPRAQALAKRFSLGRLRASAGTLVYLETQSVHRMAEALGHKNYEPDLLSRYLPPALQEFFQERWIRIFQNGILSEALKNSPHLLQATDFDTASELESFLSRHALKLLPGTGPAPSAVDTRSEVAFGLDVGIFAALIGVERAVANALEQAKSPAPNALRLAALTRALTKYVESVESGREDLREQLSTARGMANPAKMEAFIYA